MKLKSKAVTNGIYVHRLAWQRALTYKAIPKWSRLRKNRGKILATYIKAQTLNLTSRTKYEVDHEIPIYHQLICGLHVHENLQILSHAKNQSKSNFFVPYREINGRKYYFTSVNGSIKQPKISKKYNQTKKNVLKLAKKRQKQAKNKVLTFKKRK